MDVIWILLYNGDMNIIIYVTLLCYDIQNIEETYYNMYYNLSLVLLVTDHVYIIK